MAANAFAQSHWSYVLVADSLYGNGVPRSVLYAARLIPITAILFAIGSVVTPLGLYSTTVVDAPVTALFGKRTPCYRAAHREACDGAPAVLLFPATPLATASLTTSHAAYIADNSAFGYGTPPAATTPSPASARGLSRTETVSLL